MIQILYQHDSKEIDHDAKFHINGWKYRGRCMVRKRPAEHGQELHSKPKVFVTAEAYLSATFVSNISDSFDLCHHWVLIVRGW